MYIRPSGDRSFQVPRCCLLAMFRTSLTKTVLNVAPRASRVAARPALARGYHEKVISHYEQPRNVRHVSVWAVPGALAVI